MIEISPAATGVLLAAALAVSWSGVEFFRRWSLGRNLLDVPNDRSSHSTPTPRGGGLVIAAACLLGYVMIAAVFGAPFFWGYIVGALIVAAISWLDDLYSLPFWSRLIAHTIAALILITDVGYWRDIFLPVFGFDLHLGPVLGVVVTAGWVVWLLNAYNFMDGIDGIAALQAAIAAIGWSVLAFAFGLNGVFLFAALLACVSTGFLIHNWEPAKIFMGDVGSAFLGYTLAAFPLLAGAEATTVIQWLPLAGVLLVWFFVLDTVFTLARRALARKKVWEAHREHVYQRLLIEGRNHSTVTLLYGTLAALLAITVVLALIFSGIFTILALLSLVIPTLGILYAGVRRKNH